ncbi:MAG: sigma factor-like helix-turn-helix DNA-binding protein, partial [Pseudomonadota bacterium]
DKKIHGTWLEGETAGRAKLTVDDVIAIFLDDRTHEEIAAQYGITASNVSCIKLRKSWSKYTEHLLVNQKRMAWDRRQRRKKEHKSREAQKWVPEKQFFETIYPDSSRDHCIKHLREKGATLQAIGDLYSISRERVRQILT